MWIMVCAGELMIHPKDLETRGRNLARMCHHGCMTQTSTLTLAGDVVSGDVVRATDALTDVVVTVLPLTGGDVQLGFLDGTVLTLPCDLPVVVTGVVR